MSRQTIRLAVFFFCALMPSLLIAQQAIISGRLTDSKTNQPVAFATVYLKFSEAGMLSDTNGLFSLEAKILPDTLVISFVGYENQTLFVMQPRQNWEIKLVPKQFTINEIKVIAGENPANAIVKKIIDHKNDNNKDKLDFYSYESYNKMELDADNFPEKVKNKKIMEPFDVFFHNFDTAADGKPVIPMLLSESVTENYFEKNPKTTKEIIVANKLSGIENKSMSQFSGNMYIDFNIYTNFFNLGTVSFISPFSDNALFFYKYFIQDSTKNDTEFLYKLKFKPRRTGENTFIGFFTVDMKTFAIKDITLAMSEKSSINFVENFSMHQEYEKVDDHYMMDKEQTIVNFKLEGKTLSFLGKKTTYFRDFTINDKSVATILKNKQNLVLNNDASDKDSTYWNDKRAVPLDHHEETIYRDMDTLIHNKKFIFYRKLIETLSTGYFVKGPVEIGPFYNFYSNYTYEGTRLRFGGRTSNKFSTHLMLYGYGAYGFIDSFYQSNHWKYNAGFLYLFSRAPRSYLKFDVLKDFEYGGDDFDNLSTDNFLASTFRRQIPEKIVFYTQQKLTYMKESKTGFSGKLIFNHREIQPYFRYSFLSDDLPDLSLVSLAEVTTSIRFAYREKFLNGEFLRTSLGSVWPIVEVDYTAGLKGVLNSNFAYHKLDISVDGWFELNPIGETDFTLSAGKTFGKLPFFMLDVAPSNETYYYDYYSFSGLIRYEMIADMYSQLLFTQGLNGFPFNRIPAIRKLKWRTAIVFKAYYGTLSAENRYANDLQTSSYFIVPDKMPYMEAGFAIRNIFHLLRFDVFTPLTYRNSLTVPKIGFRGSLELQL